MTVLHHAGFPATQAAFSALALADAGAGQRKRGGAEVLMVVDDDHAPAPMTVRAAGTVIAVAGEVDSSNCDALQAEIMGRLSSIHAERVALDLSELVFIGSAGVRVLLRCRDVAEERGTRVEISSAHENVRQVLDICALTDVFHLPPPRPSHAEQEGPRFGAPWW
ncbi:hypothetical protein ACTI_67580 [Actinoplanes sp. OR16]|uniref:STAS domain-containing protein n=1 Tax=Actinoplanes sp. OR16 TaxID=946334 RepID=UPI000F6E6584|nr:STAS domain-containing protein [Actinoplanes sp. OR16]BBH70073.1 hypothetical protein ACTI_67580 [Actinoplanes sp. OR16]